MDWAQLGATLPRDDSGETLLLAFPHDDPSERSSLPGPTGRELGPSCLWRFLPHIARVPAAGGAVSNIGDVLRPRQFVRHKYIVLKTLFSFEEAAEGLARAAAERVFARGKKLLLCASTLQAFPALYRAQRRVSAQPVTCLLFTPALHLQPHFMGVNPRHESLCRQLLELFEGDAQSRLVLVGAQRSRAHAAELEFAARQPQLSVHFAEELDAAGVLARAEELCAGPGPVLVGFSFEAVDAQFFRGCGRPNNCALFGPRLLLPLFRLLGRRGVAALLCGDFNPKSEDYSAGVAYATLLFELLDARHGLLPAKC